MAQSKPGFVDELPNYVRTACVIATDFEKLFTKFTSTKSVRYEWFLQIWKEMKMSVFYAGRQNDRECREFTEDCLKIASAYCLPPYQFQVRVCGLYLLYALYFRHPFEPKVKIRITLAEWKELLSFLGEIHQQQHLDVEYIFCRLRQDRAFHFVATKTELYPGVRGVGDVMADAQQQKVDMIVEQSSAISNIFQPDAIDELSTIHEEYHRHKCGLAGLNATQPDPSFNIINTSLVHDITKAVTAHENWRKNKGGKKSSGRRRRESGGHTTSESEGESEPEQIVSSNTKSATKSVGAVRAEIKARAFSTVGVTSQSRRHRQPRGVNTDDVRATTVPRKRGQRPHSSGGNRSMPTEEPLEAEEENVNDVSEFGGFLNLQPDQSGILSMPNLLGEESPIKKEDQVKKKTPRATASVKRKHALKEQSAEDKKPAKIKPKTEPETSKKTPKPPKTASGVVRKRGRPRKDSTPALNKGKAKEMPETEVTTPVPKNPKKCLNLDADHEATYSVTKNPKKCLNLDADHEATSSVTKNPKKCLNLDADQEATTSSATKNPKKCLNLDADQEATTSSATKNPKKCLNLDADQEATTSSVPKDSEKCLNLDADQESSVTENLKKCLTLDADQEVLVSETDEMKADV